MYLQKIKRHFQQERQSGVSFSQAAISLGKKTLSHCLHLKGNVITGYKLYGKPLLISYSRSGTNWVRYFIEVTTNKPTPGQKRVVVGYKYFIDRAHAGYVNAQKYRSILLLLRDYKECLVRHHKLKKIRIFSSPKDFLNSEKLSQPPIWYIKNLDAFDKFKEKKLLIYYEDLISEPDVNLRKIGEFLDISTAQMNTFIDSLDDHKNKSIQAYTSGTHQSDTSGEMSKLRYHSQKLTSEEILAFDSFYKDEYPDLFNKYLSRYEINRNS